MYLVQKFYTGTVAYKQNAAFFALSDRIHLILGILTIEFLLPPLLRGLFQ